MSLSLFLSFLYVNQIVIARLDFVKTNYKKHMKVKVKLRFSAPCAGIAEIEQT